jgi:UDP-glucose:(heptosyl)LPS alpha-1,3-glucosyltransferase
MKIALIRRQYSGTGGAELYLNRLMEGLNAKGHELHLFAEKWEAVDGVEMHAVVTGGNRAQRPVRFAQEVAAQLKQMRFDCVFSLERTLQQDVYRAGDGVHKVWLHRRIGFAPWWKRPFIGRGAFHGNMCELESQTFSPMNTRRVIVNSEMVAQEIRENFDFPAKRIHLVRNGIDLERFTRGDKQQARTRYGLNKDDYVLLFVGSGWERKGLKFITNDILPRVRARIPNVKLLVIGKGREAGLNRENVRFYGPELEVEQAYRAGDLFIFLPIYEPSANVCIEALAAGLPVITSSQNGAGEFIQRNINGTVLDRPTDFEAAVEAVHFWHERRNLPIQMERNSLSINRNVEETVRILEMAAAEKEK